MSSGPPLSARGQPVAGVLLTGGASRRMGFAKAAMVVEGRPLAMRLAELLGRLTGPALEVGPGYSGLARLHEPEAGSGPLTALAVAAGELARRGHRGPAVVLSCDLVLLDRMALARLVFAPGDGAVVPVVGGRRQPLCARWSAADLREARSRASRGIRAIGDLPAERVTLLEGDAGGSFADSDTPEDLARLGVAWSPPPGARSRHFAR